MPFPTSNGSCETYCAACSKALSARPGWIIFRSAFARPSRKLPNSLRSNAPVKHCTTIGMPLESARSLPSFVSTWPAVEDELGGVWQHLDEARVDLGRLLAYRGKKLHAVGPPAGQIRDTEIGAVVLRLRVGFETLRRKVAHDAGEWWPYIEAVHSNIPEFCLSRSSGRIFGSATLSAGDLVWFEIVGIHPQETQDRLRFRLNAAGPVGGEIPDSGWLTENRFEVTVPLGRSVAFHLFVADVDDLANDEEWVCSCKVRPPGAV